MKDPKFKKGDLVRHTEDGKDQKPRKITSDGPVKDAHEEAYKVEGLSGVIPAHVLEAAPAPKTAATKTPATGA